VTTTSGVRGIAEIFREIDVMRARDMLAEKRSPSGIRVAKFKTAV
jgi:hypothetical protein